MIIFSVLWCMCVRSRARVCVFVFVCVCVCDLHCPTHHSVNEPHTEALSFLEQRQSEDLSSDLPLRTGVSLLGHFVAVPHPGGIPRLAGVTVITCNIMCRQKHSFSLGASCVYRLAGVTVITYNIMSCQNRSLSPGALWDGTVPWGRLQTGWGHCLNQNQPKCDRRVIRYRKKEEKKRRKLLLSCSIVPVLLLYFLQLYCPNGISPMGNSGCFPRGKRAATESRYPTYGACRVF